MREAALLDGDEDGEAPVRRTALAPATRVLLTLASAAIVIWGLSTARDVVGPLLLGAVLVLLFHPLRAAIKNHGGPSWVATLAVAACAYLTLAALAVLIALALAQFVRMLGDYSQAIEGLWKDIQSTLEHVGLTTGAPVAQWLDPVTILKTFATLGQGLASAGVAFFLVLGYIFFMVSDGGHVGELTTEFGSSHGRVILAFTDYSAAVRRYFVVSAIFGAIVAIIDGLLLWALGIPGAFVWAVLAFLTNFIPNIGFFIGLVPPTILALVTGGWALALVVIAMYCVVNFLLQSLVQPHFVSRTVRLGLTLTFFSVVFWSVTIGALGALLAIPLTLFVRMLLLEAIPASRWARWLTGDRVADTGSR
jgi:predicted PurR-regulated permease PerM